MAFHQGRGSKLAVGAMVIPTGSEGQTHPGDQSRRHPGSPPRGGGLTTTQKVQGHWQLSQSHQEPLGSTTKLQTPGRVVCFPEIESRPTWCRPVSPGDSLTQHLRPQWSSGPQGKLWDKMQICHFFLPSFFPFSLTSLSLSLLSFC